MAKRQKYTDKEIIKAIRGGGKDADGNPLKGSGGIISTIARRLGADWHTVKIAINTRPKIGQAYRDECEAVKDAAESVLIKNISEGNAEDAKWYLSRKGRDRGYGTTIKVQDIDYTIFNLDELERIANGEEESAVYADAIKRITAGTGES